MGIWNRDQVILVVGAVRKESFQAAVTLPEVALDLVVSGSENHYLVVAAEENWRAGFSQFKKSLNDFARGRAAIDVIAEKDDLIIAIRLNRFEKVSERHIATVDVSYGQCAHHPWCSLSIVRAYSPRKRICSRVSTATRSKTRTRSIACEGLSPCEMKYAAIIVPVLPKPASQCPATAFCDPRCSDTNCTNSKT